MNTKPVNIKYHGVDVKLSILNLSSQHVEKLQKSLPCILEKESYRSIPKLSTITSTTSRDEQEVFNALVGGRETIHVHNVDTVKNPVEKEDIIEQVSKLPIDLIIELIEGFINGNAKHWWKSKTIWTNIISLACFVGIYFGVDLAGYIEVYFLILPVITTVLNITLRKISNSKLEA
jgi:hypothetical protein